MTDTIKTKKVYVKPEVKSEVLGPEVLFCTGSPVDDQKQLNTYSDNCLVPKPCKP